ncbi:hypothetical protein CONPUDRAFT_71239 [Coniophora puteana RWD-64-598 SS2]|uniref:CxC2-like cysteine cluster KDZ transposase-associated domain-containing protein n=1 Tax=Coniophora puteana (strain RWD-64-598) TaxID=741705 RepID=A0A5M3MZ80_CONPW|nr:uncharacterized protein CONPUDRAFT_71239 [Coniophora puteana RWD-64-598 SS2]EIW84473.1 hypothetical protein CONPUDRAFT_71239 [Coniophora puteana RWD-64-598 SS2]
MAKQKSGRPDWFSVDTDSDASSEEEPTSSGITDDKSSSSRPVEDLSSKCQHLELDKEKPDRDITGSSKPPDHDSYDSFMDQSTEQVDMDQGATDVGDASMNKSHGMFDSDNPLGSWTKNYRSKFLDELLAFEAPDTLENLTVCRHCHKNLPTIRCEDCYSSTLRCEDCAREYHSNQPFHCIQKWNGRFFERSSLAAIGFKLQLGHEDASFCWHRSEKAFTVLDLRGSRYRPFMLMAREWNHLKMLKHGARGHDSSGIAGTKDGELAVLCPACPHPGKNLPDDWMSCPPEKRYPFLFLMSPLAPVSSILGTSPLLKSTRAYRTVGHTWSTNNVRQEKSTCVSHNAVNMADTKSSKGLASTGIGTVDCVRHNMKRPRSVGHLQKGERYVNMDFLFVLSVADSEVVKIVVSYDIACQWSLNLAERIKKYPHTCYVAESILGKCLVFLVPKFHLPAHIEKCQINFSFNLMPLVARTDGEAPEQGWSDMDPLANSAKEQGPGTQIDTFNSHFGDYNWKKVYGMAVALMSKMDRVRPERLEHHRYIQDMEKMACATFPGRLAEWKADMAAWEEDHSQSNPFQPRERKITMPKTKLRLAQAEAQSISSGTIMGNHGDISHSEFILEGMDLETWMRKLTADKKSLNAHSTDHEKSKLQQRRLIKYAAVQGSYMPFVACMREQASLQSSEDGNTGPLSFTLWLPSALPPTMTCDTLLLQCEWDLRYTQAHDTLEELRDALRLQKYMLSFKDCFLCGQGASTRARESLKVVDGDILASTTTYRVAWSALHSLALRLSKSGWEEELRELRQRDICAMGDLLQGQTQGTTSTSWIWINPSVADGKDKGLQDSLRIEWCKSHVRANRWNEEFILLKEEMRHVLQFLQWQADWWLDKSVLSTDESVAEGGVSKRTAALEVLITHQSWGQERGHCCLIIHGMWGQHDQSTQRGMEKESKRNDQQTGEVMVSAGPARDQSSRMTDQYGTVQGAGGTGHTSDQSVTSEGETDQMWADRTITWAISGAKMPAAGPGGTGQLRYSGQTGRQAIVTDTGAIIVFALYSRRVPYIGTGDEAQGRQGAQAAHEDGGTGKAPDAAPPFAEHGTGSVQTSKISLPALPQN